MCAVLAKYPEVELVSARELLPGLITAPAMTTWKVYDPTRQWFEKVEDLPEKRKGKIVATCFPPSASVMESFHIERCMRVYPHLQDTGGFFIAVLQKKEGEERWRKDAKCEGEEEEEEEKDVEDDSAQDSSTQPQQDELPLTVAEGNTTASSSSSSLADRTTFYRPPRRQDGPYTTMVMDGDAQAIVDFFGIDPHFVEKNFMLRSEVKSEGEGEGKGKSESGGAKSIYFISDGVRDFLCADAHRKAHIINSGLKIFTKHSSKDSSIPCSYRLVTEGLPVLAPHLTKRLVRITQSDLRLLLETENPFFSSFLPTTREQLEKMPCGSVAFVLDFKEGEESLWIPTQYYAGWVGKTSCHLLLSMVERRSLELMMKEIGKELGAAARVDGEKREELKEGSELKEVDSMDIE